MLFGVSFTSPLAPVTNGFLAEGEKCALCDAALPLVHYLSANTPYLG
ncbi:hypothetical protein [Budvicia aquatica]|uniref:Uncharacterized protein n=1 Tax=Budvicia aquatica TaxID=82979 RepID=A0A484ZDV8_9GAMM|nr:hypothetical protein [Budvicia aquatica]VFS45946.1 Uncharacterised protein [Budvicia aquatica]